MFHIPVGLPNCGAMQCYFALLFSASSPSINNVGSGMTGYYLSASIPTYEDFQVTWQGAATGSITSSMLVWDPTNAHYWYGQSSNSVVDGGTINNGSIGPTTVPVLGPVTVSATASANIPPSWGQPRITAGLSYPNNGPIAPLLNVVSSSVVFWLPNIPGATIRLSAYASDPTSTTGQPDSSMTSVPGFPLSTTTATLTTPALPTVTSPTAGSTVSLASDDFDWTVPANGFIKTELRWADADGGLSYCEIMSANERISFARLVQLGLPLMPGATSAYVQNIGTVTSLNAMVDESILAPLDYGMTSRKRVDFTLTP